MSKLHYMQYAQLGWSVIPFQERSKEPALRSWRKWQETRPTEATLRRWFAQPRNIGLVCGDVSGGLVVRDFDAERTFHDWASSRTKLAEALPTVKTSRGYHVYCRMSPCPRLKTSGVESGELRANGACILAPPSIHPDGSSYHWLNEPKGELPLVTLEDLGISTVLHSQHSQGSQHSKGSKPRSSHVVECEGALDSNVLDLHGQIRQTIPSGPGQRNKKLFELARRLKAVSPNADQSQQLAAFDSWWELAVETIGTKDYAISLDDFLRACESATTAYGATMQTHLENAIAKGVPTWVPDRFSEPCKLLAALCKELHQHSGDKTFFLSTHTASDLLAIPVMTCWRWLNVFEKLGAIEKVENGSRIGRRASLFRYNADSDDE